MTRWNHGYSQTSADHDRRLNGLKGDGLDLASALGVRPEALEAALDSLADARYGDALNQLIVARSSLERAERYAVQKARQHGATWTEIGDYFGITKQAATKRFRDIR